MIDAPIVHTETLGYLFKAVDPASYPFGEYEYRDELEVKRDWWLDIEPGEVVVDVGASWGGYALLALAQGATVIAVEPGRTAVGVLERSVAANGWTDRCTVVRDVLGDGSALDDERYRRDMLSFFNVAPEQPSRMLDSLVVELGLERLDRIKSDIEGAEVELLRGARETLARFKPKLLIEDHTNDRIPGMSGIRAACRELLAAAGYTDVVCWKPATGNEFMRAGYGR